nr:MAG: rep protein [Cressdnaviricota sp.]
MDDHIHQHGTERSTTRMRSRNWFGTIWSLQDKDFILALETKYKIVSDDDHTQDNQLHWHCLLIFKNPVQRPPTTTTHWEKPHDLYNSRKYCLDKGPNYLEEGCLNLRCQNGTEWNAFVNLCKSASPKELIDSPFSQMYANYMAFAGVVHNQFANLSIMDGDLENLWLCGDPGTGKTKFAWDHYPDLYIKAINKWWDGYHGQEVVLLDDWDPRHEVLTQHLKIWADRYPFRGECKGSSLMIRPKIIIVTSNYTIEQCFQNPEDVEAIRRRFKVHRFWKLGNQFNID